METKVVVMPAPSKRRIRIRIGSRVYEVRVNVEIALVSPFSVRRGSFSEADARRASVRHPSSQLTGDVSPLFPGRTPGDNLDVSKVMGLLTKSSLPKKVCHEPLDSH